MAIISIITTIVLGTGSLDSSPAEDIIHLLHTAFIVFAGICVVGLFFSLARDRK
jgi:hypothetical protein